MRRGGARGGVIPSPGSGPQPWAAGRQAAAGTGRVLNIPGTDAFRGTTKLRIYSFTAVKFACGGGVGPAAVVNRGGTSTQSSALK